MPIDDRAHLPFSIEAPAPLPHVSRRALANVRDALPIPKHCPHCGEDVALVENSVIYNGKTYGKWPYIYRCAPCDAYVGLHPHTDIPLGTLAKKPLRKARIAAKAPTGTRNAPKPCGGKTKGPDPPVGFDRDVTPVGRKNQKSRGGVADNTRANK